jgi:hypothetical protein
MRLAVNVNGSGGYLPANYIHYNLERLPSAYEYLGASILGIAALGVIRAFRSQGHQDRERRITLKVSLVWILSFFLFQLLFPAVGDNEGRYLLPIIPSVMMLFSQGVFLIQEWCCRESQMLRHATASLVALAVFLPLPLKAMIPVTGYARVLEAIPYQDGTVVLVSSWSSGEGALVVEQRLRDRQRRAFVLRASKVLGVSTWMGRAYQLILRTPQEIQEYLNRVPVHFIVLDDSGYTFERKDPHHELLRQAVSSRPDTYVLLGRFPIRRGNHCLDSAVSLYENTRSRGRVPDEIRLDLSHILGRELKTSVGPSSKPE